MNISIDYLWYITGKMKINDFLVTIDKYYNSLRTTLEKGQAPEESDYLKYCLSDLTLERTFQIRGNTVRYWNKYPTLAYNPIGMSAYDYTDYTYEENILVILKNFFDIFNKIKTGQYTPPVEITVTDHGRLCIYEGMHRTMAYLALGITDIPCTIIKSNIIWDNFKAKLADESINAYKGERLLYNPIMHHDFKDWTILRDDRYPVIKSCLANLNVKTGADLGCHYGYYTHRLTMDGYQMTGFDLGEKEITNCNYLSNTYGINCTFVKCNIMDREIDQCDFMLMLSLYYHLVRANKESAISFLKKCLTRVKYIIIDDEPNTRHVLAEDLKEICPQIKKLFTGKDNRSIYLLTA